MLFRQSPLNIFHACILLFLAILCKPSLNLAQGDTWTKRADMPTARGALSTSVVNGIIYAIGGGGGDAVGVSIVQAYDPATDIWTNKSNMPTPRAVFSAGVVDGKIYAIGGQRSLGAPDLSTVEMYDPATNTWSRKANMPTARRDLAASAVDGKIYAIGGLSGAVKLSLVEAYDPATDTWTQKAFMLTPREGLATSVVNGKIYAVGGNDGSGRRTVVEEYDPATNTWTRKADMPTPKVALSAATANGKLYAFGGSPNSFPYGPVLAIVEEFDPTTNAWIKRADMPTARSFLATSTVNEKVYAIGGFTTGFPFTPTSTVEEYEPTGVTSVELNSPGHRNPKKFTLHQNYPNPFWSEATSRSAGNPSTTLRYAIPKFGFMSLKVYNLYGQEIETIVSQEQVPGEYEVSWNPKNLPSGVYVYRLQTGEFAATKKLMLLK